MSWLKHHLRGVCGGLAWVLAVVVAVGGLMAVPALSASAVSIPNASGAGYAMYLPQSRHYTWLGAYKDPTGRSPSGLSWCTEVDAIAPNSSQVIDVTTLEGKKNLWPLGGADIALENAAQMAWILDHYEGVDTADSRAAISAIVHLNYDSSNADSWGTYWGTIQSKYPGAAALVRRYVAEAKASGVHHYSAVTTEGGNRSAYLQGIGVQTQSGAWIAGIPVRVTLEGPAVFTATKTNTWSGTTLDGPIKLDVEAEATGDVGWSTEFDYKHWVGHANSKPGFQNMLFNVGDPGVHTGPSGSFSVKYASIKTTARGVVDKVVPSLPAQTITDKVCYSSLIPGKEYTLSGRLKDKATGGDLIASATKKPYTASKTFTPEKEEGCVDVVFKVDGRDLVGKTTVVFEDLLREGKSVVTHADIEDHDQSVPPPPTVKTTAWGRGEGDKTVAALPDQTITDKVCYTNLVPGKEYSLHGTLMNKATGKPLEGEGGKPYKASRVFTPKEPAGCVEMVFKVDGRHLTEAPTVVFEDLLMGKIKVATHADIEDKGQTIPPAPTVKTTAWGRGEGDKTVAPLPDQTITDKVCYTNLVPGKEYSLHGTLMNKATRKPLEGEGGKPYEATRVFTPKEPAGCVNVEFVVDGRALAGKTTVVFEDLLVDNIKVATHADIDDEGQTVRIPPLPPTPPLAHTGVNAGALGGLAAVGVAAGGVLISSRRKRGAHVK